MAGAVFGEGGVSLFVAAAALYCIFSYKMRLQDAKRKRSPKRRVRDDDFMAGSWSDYPRIVFLLAEAIQGFSADILNSEFHGRRSIW